MANQSTRLPKYCKRPDHDSAFFWHGRKKIYLPGKYNSEESLVAYHKAVAELSLAKAAGEKVIVTKKDSMSIAILVDEFLKWADLHYVKDGKSTRTNLFIAKAAEPLLDLYATHEMAGYRRVKPRLLVLFPGFSQNRLAGL